jgi:hypothetical protein
MSAKGPPLLLVLVGGVKKALLIMGDPRLSGIGDVDEGRLMQRANLGNI